MTAIGGGVFSQDIRGLHSAIKPPSKQADIKAGTKLFWAKQRHLNHFHAPIKHCKKRAGESYWIQTGSQAAAMGQKVWPALANEIKANRKEKHITCGKAKFSC